MPQPAARRLRPSIQSQERQRGVCSIKGGSSLNRITGLTGLILSIATAALAQAPAPQQPPEPPPGTPPIFLEERAYVRRFTVGATVSLTPLNLFPKENIGQKVEGTTPIEFNSAVDPKSNRAGFAVFLQYALNERWAVAFHPTYRPMAFHAFIQRYEGVDNSSTFLDERARYDINEDTKGRFIDIPILARYFTKDRHEGGGRWFLEGGPTMRLAQQVRTARDTVPPVGARFQDSIPIEYKKNTLGATVGIGGQLIDDFGIRTLPEVRYTYWFNKPFDSIHGRTRGGQLEILFTLSF